MTTEHDTLWDSIKDWLAYGIVEERPPRGMYPRLDRGLDALQRLYDAGVVYVGDTPALVALRARLGSEPTDEDCLHEDDIAQGRDNMVAAIVEAAEYAIALKYDEPLPDCKHEHYAPPPDGRRMFGNCQDQEWCMRYGG